MFSIGAFYPKTKFDLDFGHTKLCAQFNDCAKVNGLTIYEFYR